MSDAENIVQFPDPGMVDAEAADWVVRFDTGEVTAEDYARFQEWQSRSPLHREAAQRLAGVFSGLDALKACADPFPAAAAERWLRREPPWHAVIEMPWRKIAYAAACLLAVAAGGLFYAHWQTPPPVVLTYETAVGGQKTVALPDGSTALLNTDSKLVAEFSGEERNIRIARGEVYFDVFHNDKRPFTVFSGGRRVRDIGTAFDVRLRRQALEVTVTKGAVELAVLAEAAQPTKAQRLGVLTQGQNAVFDDKIEYLRPLSDTEINRQLAWRQGVLVYAGEPLARVVADVSRYTKVKIELGSPRLAELPVGGYFEIDKIGAMFEALENNFGIHAQWRDSLHVRLVADDAKLAPRRAPPQ
jgi:transmembrane sensor